MHRPRRRTFSLHHSSTAFAPLPNPPAASPLTPSNKLDVSNLLLVVVLVALLLSLPRVRRWGRAVVVHATELLVSSPGRRTRDQLGLIPLYSSDDEDDYSTMPSSPLRNLANMPSKMLSKLTVGRTRGHHPSSSSFSSGPRHFVVTPVLRLSPPVVHHATVERPICLRSPPSYANIGLGWPSQPFLSSSTIRPSSSRDDRRARTPSATSEQRFDVGGWVMPLGQVPLAGTAWRDRVPSSSPFFLRIADDEHLSPYKPWAPPTDDADDGYPSFNAHTITSPPPLLHHYSTASSISSLEDGAATPVSFPPSPSSTGTDSSFALDKFPPVPSASLRSDCSSHSRQESKVHQPLPRLASLGSPLLEPDWTSGSAPASPTLSSFTQLGASDDVFGPVVLL